MTDATPLKLPSRLHAYWPFVVLAVFFCASLALKLPLLSIGAPYTTIDDHTLFEAGFLVWFGEAPPQRTYIESWVVGISSILTYLGQLIASGNAHLLNVNLVADAYRSFTENPEPFVRTYRLMMLAIDLGTAIVTYFLSLALANNHPYRHWLATFSAALFLLSYNSIWCYLVARPDTATAFLTALGILCYFQSNFAQRNAWIVASAIILGIATGFKLHAAMAVFFIGIDLWRHLGFRKGIPKALAFGMLAFVCFLISAGTTLFDPLLYIKLRVLNIRDDASPWIHWGDQFLVVLRGSGWIIAPLILVFIARAFFTRHQKLPESVKSALFISCLFLISFCAIRQLRAYWMLPALPLFYAVATYCIAQIRFKPLVAVVCVCLAAIFSTQCIQQFQAFSHTRFSELRNWVTTNVNVDDPIYIIGYDTLFLACNTRCLEIRKAVIQDELENALALESFTLRHVRLWEERAQLQLMDMLNVQSTTGFNYYGINSMPVKALEPHLAFQKIRYVFIMQDYYNPEYTQLIAQVKRDFDYVTTVNAPGGKAGTGGLPYAIYRRK